MALAPVPSDTAAARADLAAVDACRDGRPEGLEHLYLRHSSSCLALARGVLRDGRYAEDAVQEAFMDVWRAAARFDASRTSVRSWMLMLTHRRAVDRVRVEQRQATTSSALLPDRPCHRQDTEAQAERSLAAQALRTALGDLPAVQVEVLVLAYWGGNSQTEVAQLTRAPLGTVKDRTRRALGRLGQALQDTRAPLAERAATRTTTMKSRAVATRPVISPRAE